MTRRLLNLMTGLSLLACVMSFVVMFTGFGIADVWLIEPGESAGACGIALVFGLVAAFAYAASRRRHPPVYCQRCGYDLRATPDRCPECGATAGA